MFQRYIATVGLLCFTLLSSSLYLEAQTAETTSFYVPAMRSQTATGLGIAMINPTLSPVRVVLTARGDSGQTISGTGIVNPVAVTIAAQGQVAFVATDLFGSGLAGLDGSITITSDSSSVRGLFILFGTATSDGGDLFNSSYGRILFPGVDGQTWIHAMNTAAAPVSSATLSVYNSAGVLVGRRVLAFPGYGSARGTIGELVPAAASIEGYAVLEAQPTAGGLRPNVFVGMASRSRTGDLAVIPAKDDAARMRSAYVPHIAIGGGFNSRLKLVNTHVAAQLVRLTLSGAPELISERTIPANGQLDEDLGRIFNLAADAIRSGYLKIETISSTPGVDGHVEIGTPDNVLLTAVAMASQVATELVFPWVVEGGSAYTGLALMNPDADESAAVIVEAYSDGKTLASSVGITLEPKEHRAALLRDLLPNFQLQQGGYLRVLATPGIHALELLVPTEAGGSLVGVPPTRVVLNEQVTGTTVSRSTGAIVISEDQNTELIVPPGAMVSDGRVMLTTLDPATLPPADDNQSPLAALEATAGARFDAPVRFRVELAEPAEPGSKIEVWLLNSATSQYERTEFVATVDDDGRTAWADVTHFTTYVLRSDKRLPVLAPLPESGFATDRFRFPGYVPGALYRISFPGPRGTSIRARIVSIRDGEVEVEVPRGTLGGRVRVMVQALSPGGRRVSAYFPFTVLRPPSPVPTLDTIEPSRVAAGQTISVLRLRGSDFVRGSFVLLDGERIPTVAINPTLLGAAIPEEGLTPGIHRVQVVSPAPGGGVSRILNLEVQR